MNQDMIIGIGDIIRDSSYGLPHESHGIVLSLNETKTKAIILWLRTDEELWSPIGTPNITAVLNIKRLKQVGAPNE